MGLGGRQDITVALMFDSHLQGSGFRFPPDVHRLPVGILELEAPSLPIYDTYLKQAALVKRV